VIENLSEDISKTKLQLDISVSTLQTTQFLYKYMGEVEINYIQRAPLTNYYPLNTIEEINNYVKEIYKGNNTILGFYTHFPALVDESLVVGNTYPLSFMVISSKTPTEKDLQDFQEFIEDHFNSYYLTDFKKNSKLIKILTPYEFLPYYSDAGTTASIAPIVGWKPFSSKLTKNIYMAGSGVQLKLAPSVIQASKSGHYVAQQVSKTLIDRIFTKRINLLLLSICLSIIFYIFLFIGL
jgi:hypothetical protein